MHRSPKYLYKYLGEFNKELYQVLSEQLSQLSFKSSQLYTNKDPIPDCKPEEHPLPILINREEEWEVEEILNSY